MSVRVAFLPVGSVSAVHLDELGRIPAGAWGAVDDQPWMATEGSDGLELLYLSQEEYQYAVRGLPPDEIGQAVLHRRKTFSADVPGQALGAVAQRASACLGHLSDDATAAGVRADLLNALASFTAVNRLAQTAPLDLLDFLREGDAEIVAELESPSVRAAGDFDRDGAERETRRRFAAALGQIAASRGQPEKARTLPYFDVERTYFVTPSHSAIEQRAKIVGDPIRAWRDGVILPMPERMASDVRAFGHSVTVLFPASGPFIGALTALTPAQFEVELAERMTSPGFAPYLNARRAQQATLRVAAYLITGADAEIGRVLAEHAQEEASRLGTWLARDAAQAPGLDAMPAKLVAVVEAATLLVTLCRRQGRLAIASKVEALARALTHVVQDVGS